MPQHRIERAPRSHAGVRDRAPLGYVLACAGVYVATLLAYGPSVGYAPIPLDDLSQLRHLSDRPLVSIWSSDAFGHFRPLKNLLFWWMAGDAPARVASVRGVALAALLVSMALVQRLMVRVGAARGLGLAVAALWALNPTSASTLCWLSTTNVVIGLLGVLVYLTCCEHSLEARSKGRRGWALAAALALVLSLLSHELALIAPLLAWALRHARGGPRPSLRQPVIAGSLLIAAAYLSVHALRDAPSHSYRAEAATSALRSFSAARYFVDNVLLYLWPRGRFGVLLTDAPSAHLLRSGVCWTVVLGLAILAHRLRGRDRLIDLGVVWLLATLLPVCNLIPLGNTPVAVHYLFVPGIGLSILLCRGGLRVSRSLSARAGRAALLGAGLALAALWLPETRRVVAAWRSEEALYLAASEDHPDNVEVLSNLASHYLGVAQYDRARPLLARARALAPDDEGVLINGVALHVSVREPGAALQLLDQASPALRARPEFAIRRGEVLEALGRDAEAAVAFERGYDAAQAAPEQRFIGGYRLLVVLLRLGQGARAEALLARLLAEFPERAELQLARQLMSEE